MKLENILRLRSTKMYYFPIKTRKTSSFVWTNKSHLATTFLKYSTVAGKKMPISHKKKKNSKQIFVQ